MVGWVGIALVAVACIVVGAALCAIWWWVPKFQIRGLTFENDKDRAATEDNFRKTVGQVIGGAAVLVGAGLAYLQFSQQQDAATREALRQQEASAKQLLSQQQASENSLKASQALLISNQVAKGFEQLGNKESVVMRLGGIYALEGVMNAPDSQYRVPVLEALCAFVRDGAKVQAGEFTKPATDIQAALTVIARRAVIGPERVDLSGVNISGASLINARLDRADLVSADLRRTFLRQAALPYANLSHADLRDADLSVAYLGGTKLISANLLGATLNRADLSGADMRDALLDQKQLDGACGKDVNLPQGLTLKLC